ncbi:MAG TPA: hypothetical protein PKM73_00995 [Verrucomicrobiota bacterium]|nr:hypothetical protein [Verrucomicrobiota bacterium]HNU52826.1 hypothetical protein [Verrucomicrobiota bacterium]
MRWCTAGILFFALAVLTAGRGEAASSSVAETRAALAQWVEIHQSISKTRSDWQADREMLEQTVLLYEREPEDSTGSEARLARGEQGVGRGHIAF